MDSKPRYSYRDLDSEARNIFIYWISSNGIGSAVIENEP